ncbi:MAG TPA: O-antigen ligase family protein [Bryobacteraceae bacterium]|nr:O-antigen ligase family protein [Bryobacteraceae bacterium]
MAICLAAIAALLPLILTPHLVYYFDITPKIVVLLVGTAVALALGWREPRAQSPVLRALGILLVAQAASLAVSTVLSTDPALSLGGGAWRRFGLITQVALLLLAWTVAEYTAGYPNRARLLLRAIAGAGIPAALYGILQYFGWDPVIDPRLYHIGEPPLTIVRPPGTLGYVSYFATYLLSVIFAGVALALVDKSRAWRVVGIAAGVLGTWALVLTGTRAAMLGLGCGAALLVIWLRPRIRVRGVVGGLVAVAAITGFYFSPAGQMLRSRTLWFVEDPLGGGRPLLWRDSIRMAGARWAVGFGPETFPIHFPRYQSEELAKAYPDYYQESPHNIFIDALAGQGAPGTVVLAGITLLGFYAVWRMRDRKLAAALAASLGAVLVSQQFTAFTVPTALFFYWTVALAAGQAGEPARLPVNHLMARRACAALLSLVFMAYAASLVYADANLARVDRLIRAGHPIDAAAVYDRMARWSPPGMRTDLWYSQAMFGAAGRAKIPPDAMSAWHAGLAAAVRAAQTAEERQNAWYDLALYYARQNDIPHAEQSLRSAIDCAPNWFKPHWLLAEVLRAGGRVEEARAEAMRAADLDNGRNPEVTRTLAEIRDFTHASKK